MEKGTFAMRFKKIPEKIKNWFKWLFTTRKGQKNLWGLLFIIPAITIFIIFTVVPIGMSFALSLTNMKGLKLGNLDYVGLKNFRYIFKVDPMFWKAMKNIGLYTVITVPLTLTSSLILAVIIKKQIFGTKFFRGLFYLPGITSGVATAMVWLYLLNGNGIINNGIRWFNKVFNASMPLILMNDSRSAIWGLILMTLWGGLGGNMVLFLAGMNAIPPTLYEAAQIDGANRVQSFFRITLHLLKPSLIFALTLSLIGSPQMFEPILIMDANTTTPVYEIYKNAMHGGLGTGLATAQSIVLFVFIMLITMVMQRVNKEYRL
ncbi:MAG: sugar ABC transporter permease [Acholeplasmataceae bacterium]|nr:sugar ABC transporter permease [Acholeplasmataceae bacterium]